MTIDFLRPNPDTGELEEAILDLNQSILNSMAVKPEDLNGDPVKSGYDLQWKLYWGMRRECDD